MKTLTTDPVCGMEVKDLSRFRTGYRGVMYHFCSAYCRRTFLGDPGEFTAMDSEDDEDETRFDGAPDGRRAGNEKARQADRGATWSDYLPLMVIVALTILSAGAKQAASAGPWDWTAWMHDFMGFFLVVFSMFKLFNLEGFADGFQMYDLLAKPFRPYAYVYPFLELGLGLGYLAHWNPPVIYGATAALMVFGSLGVFRALAKGLDLECACMGTVLSVPLSTVALLEDLGMAAMAGGMLLFAV